MNSGSRIHTLSATIGPLVALVSAAIYEAGISILSSQTMHPGCTKPADLQPGPAIPQMDTFL